MVETQDVNIDNSAIDYSLSYSEPLSRANKKTDYDPYGDQTNILSKSDTEYVKSLLTTPTQPKDIYGQIKPSDYYPSANEPSIAGYYQGSILGNMPLFNTDVLYPMGVVDARYRAEKEAEAEKESIKHNQYLKSLSDNYFQIKDNLRNNVWQPFQYQAYQDLRQKFIDLYGEKEGSIKARMSPEYKLLTMKLNNYNNAVNKGLDAATEIITEYEGGYKEKNKDEIGLPQHYISKEIYNEARKFIVLSSDKNFTMDKLEDVNNMATKLTMGSGMIRRIKPVAEALSSDIESQIGAAMVNGKLINTATNHVYTIDEIKGMTDEVAKTIAPSYYEQFYGALQGKAKPTYKEFEQNFVDQITHQITKKTFDVSQPDYGLQLREANAKILQKKGESEIENQKLKIPKQETTVYKDNEYKTVVGWTLKNKKNEYSSIILTDAIGEPQRAGAENKNLSGEYFVTELINDNGRIQAKVAKTTYLPEKIIDANGNEKLTYIKVPDTKESYIINYNKIGSDIKRQFLPEGLDLESIELTGDRQTETPTNVQTRNKGKEIYTLESVRKIYPNKTDKELRDAYSKIGIILE